MAERNIRIGGQRGSARGAVQSARSAAWRGCAVLALLGVSAICCAAAARADDKALYEAAKQEGRVTWYTAHYGIETAERLGSAFEKRYPGIKANVVRTTAQVAYQRLSQDMKANVKECDVFSSTDVGHPLTLKSQGRLLKFHPDNEDHVLPQFKNIDKDDTYFITSAGLVVLTYNTDLVKAADAPKKWKDLLEPRWKNKVSIGHPGFSGYVGTWVLTMRKNYGWDFFEKLKPGNPQIGRSINDTITMLNAKERQVAAGSDGTTLQSQDKGNPIQVVYPSDGAILMQAPSSVLKDAPHPNAAKLFLNWLLSAEAVEVQVKERSISIRGDVKPMKGQPPLKDVKIIPMPTFEEIHKGIPEVIEQFRDTFGV
jgi:iron(III) transport system substrate-binding protein